MSRGERERERPCISTNKINHCLLSPLEITHLTASRRVAVKDSARVGERNVKYLSRVKERERESGRERERARERERERKRENPTHSSV